MDSTVPADLLKLKDRLEAWRTTRKSDDPSTFCSSSDMAVNFMI